MKNFEYIGLFLTEESKTKLKEWLWLNDYDFNNDLIKGTLPKNWYLDHCTLLHRLQRGEDTYLIEEDLKFMSSVQVKNMRLEINGIGISDKAMAFRCNLSEELCANKVPHITICTFNGGKPVDSNNITEWRNINPIMVKGVLKKV